jgi:hypothetical protein
LRAKIGLEKQLSESNAKSTARKTGKKTRLAIGRYLAKLGRSMLRPYKRWAGRL